MSGKCVQSILAQAGFEVTYEIIVVGNGAFL